MVDINARFRWDADFGPVQAQVRSLARDVTMLNASFVAMDKNATLAKKNIADSFISNINASGQFKASFVDLTSATEQFGKAIERRTLSLREYFREARRVYQQDSMGARLAERQVRMRQSQVIGMGAAGPSGRRQAMVVTPLQIDTSDFNTKMQVAAEKYAVFNRLVDDGATKLINWGKNTQWAGRQLTVGLTMPLVLFGAAVSKSFRDVDKELTRFAKVYGSDLVGANAAATQQMKQQIQSLAIEYSRAYGVAAKETAALAADLAATGLEGEKLLGAVSQTTRLAVLGEVDRQEAMQTTLALQSAFQQSTKDLADSINFLNAVENQTSASLQDFTMAIPKAGPVVRQLGGDVKDLAVMLTAMREGGIPAAEAANAIKSGLASMINPTKAASERLAKLGVDIQGIVNRNRGELMPTLMEFSGVINQLDSFARAKVIEELFGKYQFARISALFDNLNRQGSQTAQVLELMGASSADLAKVANKEITTLTESVSMRFTRAIEGFKASLLPIGEVLTSSIIPFIEGASKALGKMIEFFNALPEPVKNVGKLLLGFTAAAGPLIMLTGVFGNFLGYITKGVLKMNNFIRMLMGLPVSKLEILDEQTVAASRATDILTESFNREASSLQSLNKQLQAYASNLRQAAAISPNLFVPGSPARPAKSSRVVRRSAGGPIPGYGGGDIVPALLEPGESVITKEATAKFWPVIEAMNKGRLPGFNRGAIFLGMPRGYKDVQQAKQIRETLSATNIEATTGRFSKLPVTDIGTRITSIGGRSSSIPGVNGIYEEGGKKYVVKTHDTADSALAEVRGTQLTRDIFGLKTPVQELIKIKHPVTGDIIFAVRSPYDAKFAKSTGVIDEKNFFSQALAAIIRRDKDLQPDNLYGNIVTDVGQAFIANKASQPRIIGGAMPSVAEQTATNFLMGKGGARKWFAESTAEMAKRMSEDEYVKGFQTTIADAARKAKGAIGNLPYMTKEERAMYERIIDDLDEAAKIDWGAVYQFHRGITPEIKRPPTAAALAKKEAQEAEKARQRGQMAGWEYGLPYRFQSGGKVPGGYGGGDKVPAMLEPGEFVVRKEVASKNKGFLRALNSGRVQKFELGGEPQADSGLARSHVADARDESGRKIFGGVTSIENQGYNQAIESARKAIAGEKGGSEQMARVFPGGNQPLTFAEFEESRRRLREIINSTEEGKVPRYQHDAMMAMDSDFQLYTSSGNPEITFREELAKRMAAGTITTLSKDLKNQKNQIYELERQRILEILRTSSSSDEIRQNLIDSVKGEGRFQGRPVSYISAENGKSYLLKNTKGTSGKFGIRREDLITALYEADPNRPAGVSKRAAKKLPVQETVSLLTEKQISVYSPGYRAGLESVQGGLMPRPAIPPVGTPQQQRTPASTTAPRVAASLQTDEVAIPKKLYGPNGALIDSFGRVTPIRRGIRLPFFPFLDNGGRARSNGTVSPLEVYDINTRQQTTAPPNSSFAARWEQMQQGGMNDGSTNINNRRGMMGSSLMNIGFAGSMIAGLTTMNGEITAATTALTAFTTALMIAGTAIEMNQMLGGVGGKVGGAAKSGLLGIRGLGTGMAARGGALRAAGAAGGGIGGLLRSGAGFAMMGGGRALALLGGPIGIGIATAATIGILIKTLNDKRIEDMKNTAKAAFSEATQSAEYFGIELGRTAEKTDALRETLNQMGIEMSNTADQVDQDFVQKVGADFEDLINKLKGASDVNMITTDLQNAYSSLIAKGFGKSEAEAIIKEVAQQAEQTQIYLNVKGRWQGIETPVQAAETILVNAQNVVAGAEKAIADAKAAQKAATDQYFQTQPDGSRKYIGPYRGVNGGRFVTPGTALKTGPAKDIANAEATLGQLPVAYGAQMNALLDAFKNAPAEVAPLIDEFNQTVIQQLSSRGTQQDIEDAMFDYGGQLKASFEQLTTDETLRTYFNNLANDAEGLRGKTLMLQAANLGLSDAIYSVVAQYGYLNTDALDALIQKTITLTSLNEQMDNAIQTGIDAFKKQSREVENSYNSQIKDQEKVIKGLQKSADTEQKNHDAYMKSLEDESRALDERARKIQENADKQQNLIDKKIKTLQVSQDEATFEQQQRQRSFGILGALMSGDAGAYEQARLEYVQAQEDRQRELVIQGLQDRKDAISEETQKKLDAIDKEKRAIDDRARAASDAHDAYMQQNADAQDAAQKRIEKIDIEKNKTLKAIQAQINLLEEYKAQGYLTQQQVDDINGKLKKMGDRLPSGIRTTLENISNKIFGPGGQYTKIVNGLITEMAKALNVSEEEVRNMLGTTLRGQYKNSNITNPYTNSPFGSGPGGAPNPSLNAAKGTPGGVNGKINGIGTPTSDSIVARLSRGEYVVRASSVNKIGTSALDYINATGKIPGYAQGSPGGVGSDQQSGGFWGTAPNAMTVLSIRALQDLYGRAVEDIRNTDPLPGNTSSSGTAVFNQSALTALGVTMQKAQQLMGWIQAAGWPAHLQKIAWVIAMRESSGIAEIGPGHPAFNGEDFGLFQINKPSYGGQSWWSDAAMIDPIQNAKAAYLYASNNGTNFLPWAMRVNPDGSYTWDWSYYGGTAYDDPNLRAAVESNTQQYWNAITGIGNNPNTDTSNPSSAGQAAVTYATSQQGKPYSMNATPPSSWDCSKLTAWAWAVATGADPNRGYNDPNAKVRLTPYSHVQATQISKRVVGDGGPISGLLPGDILYFNGIGNQSGGHTSIYAGNNQVFEASSPSIGLRYADLNNSWNQQYFAWGGAPPGYAKGGLIGDKNVPIGDKPRGKIKKYANGGLIGLRYGGDGGGGTSTRYTTAVRAEYNASRRPTYFGGTPTSSTGYNKPGPSYSGGTPTYSGGYTSTNTQATQTSGYQPSIWKQPKIKTGLGFLGDMIFEGLRSDFANFITQYTPDNLDNLIGMNLSGDRSYGQTSAIDRSIGAAMFAANFIPGFGMIPLGAKTAAKTIPLLSRTFIKLMQPKNIVHAAGNFDHNAAAAEFFGEGFSSTPASYLPNPPGVIHVPQPRRVINVPSLPGQKGPVDFSKGYAFWKEETPSTTNYYVSGSDQIGSPGAIATVTKPQTSYTYHGPDYVLPAGRRPVGIQNGIDQITEGGVTRIVAGEGYHGQLGLFDITHTSPQLTYLATNPQYSAHVLPLLSNAALSTKARYGETLFSDTSLSSHSSKIVDRFMGSDLVRTPEYRQYNGMSAEDFRDFIVTDPDTALAMGNRVSQIPENNINFASAMGRQYLRMTRPEKPIEYTLPITGETLQFKNKAELMDFLHMLNNRFLPYATGGIVGFKDGTNNPTWYSADRAEQAATGTRGKPKPQYPGGTPTYYGSTTGYKNKKGGKRWKTMQSIISSIGENSQTARANLLTSFGGRMPTIYEWSKLTRSQKDAYLMSQPLSANSPLAPNPYTRYLSTSPYSSIAKIFMGPRFYSAGRSGIGTFPYEYQNAQNIEYPWWLTWLRDIKNLSDPSWYPGRSYSNGGDSKDDIIAKVSRGEYVMSAPAVAAIGKKNMDLINQGKLPGYYTGGLIGDPRFTIPSNTKINKIENSSNKMMKSGDIIEYNINVNVAETNASPDDIANRVMRQIKTNQNARRLRSNG